MGNPLRNTDPKALRVVTLRTAGARLWLKPTAQTRKLIGGIVARYQEKLGIELFAYNILGNHHHFLLRAPRGNSDEFFENVNREIARRMNWRLRREGQFWARRYSEQIVGTEEDALEAFLYITTNPTKHGLLRDSSKWPGLTCFQQALNERERRFSFTHYSNASGEPRTTTHLLTLSPLPQLAKMKKFERVALLKKLLYERMMFLVREREERGEGFLGLENILAQDIGEVPREVAKSPRPSFYTKDRTTWLEMKEFEKKRREDYAIASFYYRLGSSNYDFPEFCHYPPRHRKPRIEHFVEACLSQFLN